MRTKISFYVCAPCAVAILLVTGQPLGAQTAEHNVVRLNLDEYGWQDFPRTREFVGTTGHLVSLDHKGRVLVAFVTNENTNLARRGNPSLALHVLRFLPPDRLDLNLALPTDNRFSYGIYLDSEDVVYARANNVFQVLSDQEGSSGESGRWRVLGPCPASCEVLESASRRTFLVGETAAHKKDMWIIRAATSSDQPTVKRCPAGDPYANGITERFAYHSGDGISDSATRWMICEPTHASELPNTLHGSVHPLSDELILLLGTPSGKQPLGGVDLIGLDGHVKFHGELPKHDTVDHYRMTSDTLGDRFAFVVNTWRGGSRWLDVSGKLAARRVVVWTDTGQELAALPIRATYDRSLDVALSPDGRRLVVLDGDILSILEIN